MSQALVYTLLALALLLPLLGAAALRIFAGRLSDAQIATAAALMLAVAVASSFMLARSNADSLRIGNLTLLLPIAPVDPDLGDLPIADPLPQRPALPTARPTLTLSPAPTDSIVATEELTNTGEISGSAALTPTLQATPTLTPTLTPTIALTPTAEIVATATVAPTAEAPATAAPAPPQPRSYTVQPGDTVRGIAERFGVTVAALLRANGLSPAQADTIRSGQVLKLP